MNTAELKQILKPLVKQLVKESIQEQLASVITEIIRQTSSAAITTSTRTSAPVMQEALHKERLAEKQKNLNERRKMLEEVSKNSYGGINIFENVTPITAPGKESANGGAPASPLSGVDPSDPGVDISGLIGMTGGWKNK